MDVLENHPAEGIVGLRIHAEMAGNPQITEVLGFELPPELLDHLLHDPLVNLFGWSWHHGEHQVHDVRDGPGRAVCCKCLAQPSERVLLEGHLLPIGPHVLHLAELRGSLFLESEDAQDAIEVQPLLPALLEVLAKERVPRVQVRDIRGRQDLELLREALYVVDGCLLALGQSGLLPGRLDHLVDFDHLGLHEGVQLVLWYGQGKLRRKLADIGHLEYAHRDPRYGGPEHGHIDQRDRAREVDLLGVVERRCGRPDALDGDGRADPVRAAPLGSLRELQAQEHVRLIGAGTLYGARHLGVSAAGGAHA
mmetsp:Transcript_5905/g.15838  ORF Transcript_5905/g.15838 Transcript_5905/m.15838 type:complete len:308 (+) Transcript_5905:479-1402(+)